MDSTSASLLGRLRQQPDSQSWRSFVQLYEPWLRGQLRSFGLAAADVDDLVQEVMAVLVTEVPRFRHNGQRGAFRTWLRGITVNRLRQFWRERKRQATAGGTDFENALDQLTDDYHPLSQLWDREHDQHMVKQLMKVIAADFEPKTWHAFQRFVIEGQKAAVVAAELGISEGAVWTAKSHVLKRLREVAKEMLE